MVPEKLVSRIVKLVASIALLLPAFAHAQSTTLLNDVHTIAAPTVAAPVEHTFTSTSAGQYTVTLTDLGAGLTPPSPLTAATMAVTQGNVVVGTPATLQQGAATLTLTFTATANTSYTLHVVGSPAAGVASSSIGEDVAAPDNSSVGSYVDTIGVPAPQVANGESILYDSFTIATADQYTITLTDLQLPAALKALVLAVIPTGGTPAATLPVPGTNAMSTTVPLSPGTYQILAIGKTDSTVATDVGGLFSASVVGASGETAYPAKITPVGAVSLVRSAALAAGPYSLTLTDLKYPSALSGGSAVLAASVIRDDGLAMATLTAGGSQPFTVASSGNQYFAYAVASPGSSTAQGSYALQVQSTAPSPPAPPISVARAVAGPTSTLVPFSFETSIPTAGSYTITLTDFSFPGALTALDLAAVQGGALLGTPLTKAGNFTVSSGQGALTLLAFGSAAASGGVFGIDVSPASGSAVFDAAQPVGLAFVTRSLQVTTAGSYLVSAADVGFPAPFSSFDVLVTQGSQAVGQIYGGGQFNFTGAAGGKYLLDFIALPSGTFNSGTYSLTVAPAPATPTVTLSSSASSVASGGTVSLTWSSQNATTCAASGGWSGSQATSGTATSPAITGATTFTLTCSGAGGSMAQSVAVTITSPASGGKSGGGGAINLVTLLGLTGLLWLQVVRRSAVVTRRSGRSSAARTTAGTVRPHVIQS